MKYRSDEIDPLEDLSLLCFGVALIIGFAAVVAFGLVKWVVRLPARAWRAIK